VTTPQVGNVKVLVVPPRSRHTSGEGAPRSSNTQTTKPSASQKDTVSVSDTKTKQSASKEADLADSVRVVVVMPQRSRHSSGNDQLKASGTAMGESFYLFILICNKHLRQTRKNSNIGKQ